MTLRMSMGQCITYWLFNQLTLWFTCGHAFGGRFAGYVPGGHGNQRGQSSVKQSAQHPPGKQPGVVPGFYQLGFA